MPPLAPDRITEHLHETNSRLCVWLEDLVPDADPESGGKSIAKSGGEPGASSVVASGVAAQSLAARVATPRQMAGLLAELMRAGQCLRELPGEEDRDPALAIEVNQYRKNVERLRDLMPSIHGALLRERARLEQERARVESAAEWMRRSRETY